MSGSMGLKEFCYMGCTLTMVALVIIRIRLSSKLVKIIYDVQYSRVE